MRPVNAVATGGAWRMRAPILTGVLALALLAGAPRLASAVTLPDNRAYELVSPVDKNGVEAGDAVSAPDGNSADWSSIGGFGDATSGTVNLYQSRRTSTGWQTTALTPTPTRPMALLEEQAPIFFSTDLRQTVFLTQQSYNPGDKDERGMDLYLRRPDGGLSWISQGTQGGMAPREATYDDATPDARYVAFSTEESLTPDATGMEGGGGYRGAQDYLYLRDTVKEETRLVDVDNNGVLLNPEGAILGAGEWLLSGAPPGSSYLPAGTLATTTHAISNDGSKVFFETPPPSNSPNTPPPHLYVREDNSRTVAIDDPQSTGSARYEGASEDGSRVFFTSNEGLAGDPFTDKELYAYDTVSEQLTAISAGENGATDGFLYGVTAIANDGSQVYFVAAGVLSSAANVRGAQAIEGAPNLYVYDLHSGTTRFIATLDEKDVGEREARSGGPLVAQPDTTRPAQPTPNGAVLVFDSSADLTGENPTEFFEVYRYDAPSGALTCISCPPAGVTPIGNSTVSGSGGGSYGPPDAPVTMSADASRIFFDSPDSLVPEDVNTKLTQGTTLRFVSSLDVYEWENGRRYLISDGQTTTPSILDGTTPSGDDVFIMSDVRLAPQDEGDEYDIYDARVGGGFPGPSPIGPPQCSGAACHPPSTPPTFGTPASALLQEAGNLTPPASTPRPTAKPPKHAAKKKKKTTTTAGSSKHRRSGRKAARRSAAGRRRA